MGWARTYKTSKTHKTSKTYETSKTHKLLKLRPILRIHPDIPEGKVQAIVLCKFSMMDIMMGRTYQPLHERITLP